MQVTRSHGLKRIFISKSLKWTSSPHQHASVAWSRCQLASSRCFSSHRYIDTDSYLNYESDKFVKRHIGPQKDDKIEMLQKIGFNSIEDLINATIPADIRMKEPLSLSKPLTESQLISRLKVLSSKNQHTWRSFIGMGYYNCHTPPVILRNVLENPGKLLSKMT